MYKKVSRIIISLIQLPYRIIFLGSDYREKRARVRLNNTFNLYFRIVGLEDD